MQTTVESMRKITVQHLTVSRATLISEHRTIPNLKLREPQDTHSWQLHNLFRQTVVYLEGNVPRTEHESNGQPGRHVQETHVTGREAIGCEGRPALLEPKPLKDVQSHSRSDTLVEERKGLSGMHKEKNVQDIQGSHFWKEKQN